MLVFVHVVMLLARAHAVAPYDLMPPEQAMVHGAMVAASSLEVGEVEIAAIMRHESGGWIDARPGMKHWPAVASRFPRRRHYVCGLMQVVARTAAECVSWRDPFVAYRAGADVLREWHAHCARIGRRGDRRHRCARAGYALGAAAARLAT